VRIIDLTAPIQETFEGKPEIEPYRVPLEVQGERYEGVCYRFVMHGTVGTYIDFPGHIACFDDGQHAGNVPIQDLLMLDTTVIHLNRDPAQREVTAEELEATGIKVRGDVLIVHALGGESFADFDVAIIPYFGPSAIEWIASKRLRIFASDIYEKRPDQQGIFVELFRNRISAICCPVNLHALTEIYPKSCIIPLIMNGVTQLPCRFFVVEGHPA